MKDNDGIILLILGVVVFGALSFGVTKMIKKALNSGPKVENPERTRTITEQQQKVLDLKAREKKLREEQQDRMRSFNR